MVIKANLYADGIDPLRYFTGRDCQGCGFHSCGEWLERVQQGGLDPAHCPDLDPNQGHALGVVLSLDRILPQVEVTHHPVSGLTGYHAVNDPGPHAPVLVTGNALATQEVLLAVLSTTTAPFHLLFVDCLGHTVDMAVIYGAFRPERVRDAVLASELAGRTRRRDLVLPGLTAPLQAPIEVATGWKTRVGPVCAGELPLFFGSAWKRPRGPGHGLTGRRR